MQSWLESLIVSACSGKQLVDNNLLKLKLIKIENRHVEYINEQLYILCSWFS